MIRAKNYEKLSKFVKVTAKIYCRSFFLPDTMYMRLLLGSRIRYCAEKDNRIWRHSFIHSFSSANNSLHVHT